MEESKMKELYKTGDWICILNQTNNEWAIVNPEHWNWCSTREYKLIHKKHKDILDAYLKDNSVEIEFWAWKGGMGVQCWEKETDFISNYAPTTNYRLKPKQIDLNNTWCEATEENYNALLALGVKEQKGGFVYPENGKLRTTKNTIIEYNHDSNIERLPKIQKIHLVNGQFEYVKEEEGFNELQNSLTECEFCHEMVEEPNHDCGPKPEIDCYFANHGVEKPDFECEIFYNDQKLIIGTITKNNKHYSAMWTSNGELFHSKVLRVTGQYDLTPIKKHWYEDESNFPTLIVTDDGMGAWVHYYKDGKAYDINDTSYSISGVTNWRRASKEELLNLYKQD